MQKRWLILAAGVAIQTILGGIYAWSIFVPELNASYSLSKGQCGVIFGLCIAIFTLAMIPGGRLLAARGPRLTAIVGAVLFAMGYLVASWSGGRFGLLLLGVSVLSGAGIGFGYVCPLTVGIQWFPRHKGLITGVAVAGFGGGAILLSAVAVRALETGMEVLVFFRWLGVVSGVLLVLAALVLDVPEKDKTVTVRPRSIAGELRSPAFLLCLFGIFTGTFSGLLVIGNLRPIVEEAGLTVELAATAVSIFAAGNALGRILWGFLFDRTRYRAIPMSLGSFAAVLALLCLSNQTWLLLVCAGLLGFGFGANFVIYASTLSSHFDVVVFPRLYPLCFLGYGLAGVVGPGVGGLLADRTGSYAIALYISIGLLTTATLLTTFSLHIFRRLPAQAPLIETVE